MGELLRPFRGGEALAEGLLTRRELRCHYVAMYPGVYLHRGIAITAKNRAECAWLWSRRRGVLAGLSAAAAHGSKWIDAGLPAELLHRNHRSPPLLGVHSDDLHRGEVMLFGGIRATSVARTAFDLARWHPVDQAIARIDALLDANPQIQKADILAVAAAHPGRRGTRGVAGVIDLADAGAQSPRETATRLLIVRAGFPRPTTQHQVFEAGYGLVARLDMAYPDYRVAIEYDGDQHWLDRRQRAHDIDRYERLERLGWTVVRVGAELLAERPHEVVRRLERKLLARGCPKTWPAAVDTAKMYA